MAGGLHCYWSVGNLERALRALPCLALPYPGMLCSKLPRRLADSLLRPLNLHEFMLHACLAGRPAVLREEIDSIADPQGSQQPATACRSFPNMYVRREAPPIGEGKRTLHAACRKPVKPSK